MDQHSLSYRVSITGPPLLVRCRTGLTMSTAYRSLALTARFSRCAAISPSGERQRLDLDLGTIVLKLPIVDHLVPGPGQQGAKDAAGSHHAKRRVDVVGEESDRRVAE